MVDLRTRFGVILALSLLPIFLYACWLAFDTGRLLPVVYALLSFIFAYGAIWLATNALIFQPLRTIQTISGDFSTGDLTSRIGDLPNAPPRIADLAKAFDSMAENISQREAAMLDSLVEKEILLREIHHRVKNNLQIIISLLNMQERKLKDDAGLSVIRETRTRINAIALVHRGLYEGEDLSVIEMDQFLDRLITELKTGLGTKELGVAIKTNIVDQNLKPDTAIPIALFIVEALTNAIQHGVPNGGNVSIMLMRTDGELVVTVSDDGPGQDTTIKQGTGLKLIKGFARQLSGRISTKNTNGHSVSLILGSEAVEN